MIYLTKVLNQDLVQLRSSCFVPHICFIHSVDSFKLSENDIHFSWSYCPEMKLWITLFVFFVDQLNIKCLSQISCDNFETDFSKGLTKTNSFSSRKRRISIWMTLLTIRSKTYRIWWVKSSWNELKWLLPLWLIVMEWIDINHEWITCFDLNWSKCCVLLKDKAWGERSWALDSHCFLYDFAQVF